MTEFSIYLLLNKSFSTIENLRQIKGQIVQNEKLPCLLQPLLQDLTYGVDNPLYEPNDDLGVTKDGAAGVVVEEIIQLGDTVVPSEEVAPTELQHVAVAPAELQHAEVALTELQYVEVAPAEQEKEVAPAELQHVEVAPAEPQQEVAPAQLQHEEVAPAELQHDEVGPVEIQYKEKEDNMTPPSGEQNAEETEEAKLGSAGIKPEEKDSETVEMETKTTTISVEKDKSNLLVVLLPEDGEKIIIKPDETEEILTRRDTTVEEDLNADRRETGTVMNDDNPDGREQKTRQDVEEEASAKKDDFTDKLVDI